MYLRVVWKNAVARRTSEVSAAAWTMHYFGDSEVHNRAERMNSDTNGLDSVYRLVEKIEIDDSRTWEHGNEAFVDKFIGSRDDLKRSCRSAHFM